MPDETVVTTPVVVTPVPVVKKNVVSQFLSDAWNKLVAVDTALNSWVSKITSGYTTLTVVAVAVLYWLLPVKEILSVILTIPNVVKSFILTILVPIITTVLNTVLTVAIDAIPYIIGVAVVAIAIVELINAVKKLVGKLK